MKKAPLGNYPHWFNAKAKDTPVIRFPDENYKKIEIFFTFDNAKVIQWESDSCGTQMRKKDSYELKPK